MLMKASAKKLEHLEDLEDEPIGKFYFNVAGGVQRSAGQKECTTMAMLCDKRNCNPLNRVATTHCKP